MIMMGGLAVVGVLGLVGLGLVVWSLTLSWRETPLRAILCLTMGSLMLESSDPPGAVLAFCRPEYHGNDGANMLFVGGAGNTA